MFMTESFIPTSEFETASSAVNNILGQSVEEIKLQTHCHLLTI